MRQSWVRIVALSMIALLFAAVPADAQKWVDEVYGRTPAPPLPVPTGSLYFQICEQLGELTGTLNPERRRELAHELVPRLLRVLDRPRVERFFAIHCGPAPHFEDPISVVGLAVKLMVAQRLRPRHFCLTEDSLREAVREDLAAWVVEARSQGGGAWIGPWSPVAAVLRGLSECNFTPDDLGLNDSERALIEGLLG